MYITKSNWKRNFRHVHVCTNDYPFLSNGFSSSTCLYEWLSISFEWFFVMYMFVQMTTISFWMDCRHLDFCTNDYHFFLNGLSSFTFLYGGPFSHFEWIFVMYISVRMTTISLYMGFRANNFPYSLYMGFRHTHSVQMTFHILCIWIFVMHILCKLLSIFFWFSMMCAMLFKAWIAWCSDEL